MSIIVNQNRQLRIAILSTSTLQNITSKNGSYKYGWKDE
jgi:hypothetical protein